MARSVPPAKNYPFLFLGAGRAQSRKSLTCQLYFERVPLDAEKRQLEELVPSPLHDVRRWDGACLTAGSDDALEYWIGQNKRRATLEDWERFCSTFEDRVLEMHSIVPLVLVSKPDDLAPGRRLSDWHRVSLGQLADKSHELLVKKDGSLAPVGLVLEVLGWLEGSPRVAAKINDKNRSALLSAALMHLKTLEEDDALDLVESVAFLMQKEALTPALCDLLYPFASTEVAALLDPGFVVERSRTELRANENQALDHAIDRIVRWMVHVPLEASLELGELLLTDEQAVARLRARAEQRKKPASSDELCPSRALWACAYHQLQLDQAEEALRCLRLAARFPEPILEVPGLLIRTLFQCGQIEEARALARSDWMREEVGPRSPRSHFEIARGLTAAGFFDEALAELERYLTLEPAGAVFVLSANDFKPLRQLPRFKSLLGK